MFVHCSFYLLLLSACCCRCARAAPRPLEQQGASSGTSERAAEAARQRASSGSAPSKKPNIIFMLVDDSGWNDFGYASSDLAFTQPNIVKAAQDGIILDAYYSEPHCTPARSSLMSGKYAVNVGMTVGDILVQNNYGLPLNVVTMADHLKSAGYRTHQLGKWNLGHHRTEYLPTNRGFDSFTGFMGVTLGTYRTRKVPKTITGLNGALDGVWDLMHGNSEGHGPVSGARENLEYYTTYLTDLAVGIIETHADEAGDDDPLFLYLAHQATHAEMESPLGTDDLPGFASISAPQRRNLGAMWIELDSSFVKIQKTLEATGMLDNTIIVMVSDNGGCPSEGSMVTPLRGVKTSLFEGGVHVPGFVWSPLLKEERRGSKYNNLMHVADWLPTLWAAAGQDASELDASLDGVNQWAALAEGSLTGDEAPRTEALVSMDAWTQEWEEEEQQYVMYPDKGPMMGYRMGKYKLIMNHPCLGYYEEGDGGGISCMNQRSALVCGIHGVKDVCASSSNHPLQAVACDTNVEYDRHFLFDIEADPTEFTNLWDTSDDMRQVASVMNAKLLTILLQAPLPAYKYPTTEGMKTLERVWRKIGGFVYPWEAA